MTLQALIAEMARLGRLAAEAEDALYRRADRPSAMVRLAEAARHRYERAVTRVMSDNIWARDLAQRARRESFFLRGSGESVGGFVPAEDPQGFDSCLVSNVGIEPFRRAFRQEGWVVEAHHVREGVVEFVFLPPQE